MRAKKGFRRSFTMTPGDRADLLEKQAASPSDAVQVCIEDAVVAERKVEARRLTAHAFNTHDYAGKERFIRINGIDSTFWLEDLEYFCEHAPPTGFNIAKVRSAEDIRVVARVLDYLERRFAIAPGSIRISCMIETAEAMREIYRIAAASARMANLHYGIEDFTHSIDAVRTPEQIETIYAASRVVSAARAAGIEPIAYLHTGVNDLDGLRSTSLYLRKFGFTGRTCVSPKHVPIVNEIFSPSEEEVAHARRVVDAHIKAHDEGLGVYVVDGQMTDGPLIKKALRTLRRAGENVDHVVVS